MHERAASSLWRASYMQCAAFPTQTKWAAFLHWRPLSHPTFHENSLMSTMHTPTESDPAHFLKIAGQGAGLASHEELWRWLQGDVQQWLSHEVMLVGWGDFRTGELQYDIVSSLPGMRSHDWTVAGIAPIISYFRDCWAAAQHQPTQLDASVCGDLVRGAG